MIRAVVFDMDGVLIDAKEWHYEALNSALGLFGIAIDRADHLAIYDGLPTSKKLELLSEQVGLPRRIHGFINDLKQHYTMEIVYAQCRPSFTHEFALSRLAERGYRLAVASNSIRASVDVMLSRAALDGYIEFSLCNSDVPRPKPDPAIYDLAIKKLALHPNEVLIVEDNDNGIRAAQASGAHLLVVKTVDEVNLQNILRRIAEIEEVAS
jgi:beta-phosphoglucomutase